VRAPVLHDDALGINDESMCSPSPRGKHLQCFRRGRLRGGAAHRGELNFPVESARQLHGTHALAGQGQLQQVIGLTLNATVQHLPESVLLARQIKEIRQRHNGQQQQQRSGDTPGPHGQGTSPKA
jgi:hypothetical protein